MEGREQVLTLPSFSIPGDQGAFQGEEPGTMEAQTKPTLMSWPICSDSAIQPISWAAQGSGQEIGLVNESLKETVFINGPDFSQDFYFSS